MATTYAVLSIEENEFCFSNIGDSKGYLLRDHKLQKKTKDHSIIQNLIDEGILTEKEARKHPQKHMIYQALGMQEEDMDPEPYITLKEKVQQGDKFILCTDGVTDMVSDKDIEQIKQTTLERVEIIEPRIRDYAEEWHINIFRQKDLRWRYKKNSAYHYIWCWRYS